MKTSAVVSVVFAVLGWCYAADPDSPRTGVANRKIAPGDHDFTLRAGGLERRYTGHTWPGGRSLLPVFMVGPRSDKLRATDFIWEFFQRHPQASFFVTGPVQSAEKQGGTGPVTLDCRGQSCPELRIDGDAPATLPNGKPSNFRGFADPCMRKDPASERLWLVYSWPNLHVSPRSPDDAQRGFALVPSVDTHLAHSDDGGAHWRFDMNLWPSNSDRSKGDGGEPGITGHEVPNILPVPTAGGVVWYGARWDYFVPEAGGFKRRNMANSFIKVMRASTVQGLANAPAATLGSWVTPSEWGVDVNLSALSPDIARNGFWNEPALHFEHDTLYLGLSYMAFVRGQADFPSCMIAVFATKPVGGVRTWKWRYAGKLGGMAEGKELGGDGLTQIEFARGRDGQLLALVTPDGWSPATTTDLFVHYGCRALELASMDPPLLARDAAGKLKVRAIVTASDQMPLGPGSFGYDPASSTGIVLARREKGAGFMTSALHATGVRP